MNNTSDRNRNRARNKNLFNQKLYWIDKLAGDLIETGILTDYKRPYAWENNYQSVKFRIGNDICQRIVEISRGSYLSVYIFLVTIMMTLLHKYYGNDEIIIGSAGYEQGNNELENMVCLRSRVEKEQPFKELLLNVRQTVIEAYSNQDIAFEDVLHTLNIQKMENRCSIFDIAVLLGNIHNRHDIEKFRNDIILVFNLKKNEIHGDIRYNASLFNKSRFASIIKHFIRILEIVIADINIKIDDINIILKEEQLSIFHKFNFNKKLFFPNKSIHTIFEEVVNKYKDCIALEYCDELLTYNELNKRSNQLARLLRKNGIGKGMFVGVLYERSSNYLMAVLAILKAGGAFVPIDPDYPVNRIEYMILDSEISELITDYAYVIQHINMLKNCLHLRNIVCLNDIGEGISYLERDLQKSIYTMSHLQSMSSDNLNDQSSVKDTAYMIYTSGSTGLPKGAVNRHDGKLNHIFAEFEALGFTEDFNCLQSAPISTDISIWQFFAAILIGGKTAIIDKESISDPEKLFRFIQDKKITVLEFVPTFMKIFIEYIKELNDTKRSLSHLKWVIIAGEPLPVEVVNNWFEMFPGIMIVNAYGPTEASDIIAQYIIEKPLPEITLRVPIGSSLPNLIIYILDQKMRLMPIGVPGEIAVSGIGVGNGYWKNEEKTFQNFVKNPFKKDSGEIIYKTGDIGRWLSDGIIDFLGRIDNQVKIRGFRIELGEIESHLSNKEEIKETVVTVWENENGDKSLCAYIVSENGINVSDLRGYLSRLLPDYMIPSYFIQIENIPLTPNGKVDKKALPKPEFKLEVEYIAPGNKIEEKLVEIWSAVLNIGSDAMAAPIGIDDNFFELGGHSLKATTMVSKIHKLLDVKVPIKVIFDFPTIRGLSKYLGTAIKEKYSLIGKASKKEYYQLSSTQKRIYILQHLEMESTSYNIPHAIPLRGSIEIEKLERTFRKIISRHESLRTSFKMIKDEPVQIIHEKVEFEMEYYDLTLNSCQPERGDSIIKDFIRPFELSNAPLLRVGLIKEIETKYILMIDMHHIITDATSLDILVREFRGLYAGDELEPLRIQYKDYAEWQNSKQQQELMKQQESYWINLFSDELPVLNLPTDYPRPVMQSFEGSSISFVLNEAETQKLKRIAKQSEATFYMTVLAMFSILLSKLSGQEDIIVGTPIAARRNVDLERIIGMFVNTLAMRNYPAGEKTFSEFLQEVKKHTLDAYENQEYQFENLVDKISLTRDTSRNPVFDVMFNLMNQSEYSNSGLRLNEENEYEHREGTAKFDLILTGLDFGKEFYFHLEYSTKLFKPGTIERFIQYFKNIIFQVTGDIEQKLLEIEILTDKEKKELLEISSGLIDLSGLDTCVHILFEEKAKNEPEKIAAVFEGNRISYKILNQKANQLARILRAKGVGSNTVVGLMTKRSFEMLIGILAILKAGGAYLPIDSEYPTERQRHMLNDSKVSILLTNYDIEGISGYIPENIDLLDIREGIVYTEIDSNLRHINKGTDLFYVIYTSGSTGTPKGVMIEHKNLLNLIKYQYEYTNINFTSVLQFVTISFDVSAQEIFSTFLFGGTLTLIHEETRNNIPRLFKVIKQNRIKTLFLPVSFLKFVMNEMDYIRLIPGEVEHIITAGEQLIINDRFKRYLRKNNIYLHNHYGPSETHVVTSLIISPTGDIPDIPSIGKPILNTSIYILDKWMHLVPVGIPGELYIGGVQVGRGYYGSEDMTREKFVMNPFIKGESIYKSGDLGRWLRDGNIDFLGRIDRQVKIRGYRIELEEIESLLIKHDEIIEVVVLVKEDANGEKYLCAYIVPRSEINVSDLHSYLSQLLPDYMIPKWFVRIMKVPLTPSGKVYRKALPEPELEAGEDYVAPRNEIEMKLLDVWSEVLAREGMKAFIGIDDNFFKLGGHSLKATVMSTKIHKVFNVNLPLAEVFKTPTIRGLAKYIREAVVEKYTAIEAVEKREYYRLSSAQKRLYILQQMVLDSVAYNMPEVIPLGQEPDIEKLEAAFIHLIERHESMRTSFHMVENEPVQKIHPRKDVEFHIQHCPSVNQNQFIKPFDLAWAPLLRVGLVRLGNNRYLLLVDMHHIISDGVSHEILERDFMSLYIGEHLPALKLQYKDYAQWQRSEKQRAAVKRQETYWLKEFAGEVPVLDLPTDYPRPALQSFEGHAISFNIGDEPARGLKRLALEEGTTLYMVVVGLYNVLLSRLSGQEDIVVGTPTAGRRHADLQHIIGMFVNTLALRNYPQEEKTFRDFLMEIKKRTLDAFENQEYHFEDLVENVTVNRDTGRNPLFDVMFSLQRQEYRTSVKEEEGEQIHYADEHRMAKFDMSLICIEGVESLYFILEYCTKLFHLETIERFIGYFKRIISQVLENREKRLSQLQIISEAEREQILVAFNDTGVDYPGDKVIHQLFEAQAEKTPDGVALIGMRSGNREEGADMLAQVQLTYCQLNKRCGQLASLLATKGVKPDTIVAIAVERAIEMIIGILGILKSGGAYLPMEPDYPRERLQYMLADSGAEILLTTRTGAMEAKRDFVIVKSIVYLEEIALEGEMGIISGVRRPLPLPSPASLAYVIYTSGSTGYPKGVMVEQGAVVNLLFALNSAYPFSAGDNYLLKTTYVFDVSVSELFGWFLGGGRIAILGKGFEKDPGEISAAIQRYMVSHINFVPAMFKAFVEFLAGQTVEALRGLKYIFLAGEVLPGEMVKQLRAINTDVILENLYGPTEAAVYASKYCLKSWNGRSKIPIGKPLDNVQIYILDKFLQLQCVGIAGELCISGSGLGRGYLNQPELSKERFCFWSPGGLFSIQVRGRGAGCRFLHWCKSRISRIYRSGDLARWLVDGNIQFLSRIDDQVKVRGYRIELGEIEHHLANHNQVKEAVVEVMQDQLGDKYLCAYMVSKGVAPGEKEVGAFQLKLKAYLSGYLPDYMIPLYFVLLEKMPLTPSGKIDRKVLPEPGASLLGTYAAPRDDVERKLAEIWSEVLGIEKTRISIDADFFQLGGHSLKATILAARLHKEVNVKLPLAEIFKRRTIKGLAFYIKEAVPEKYTSIKVAEDKEYYILSSAQQRLFILQQMDLENTVYNIPQVVKLDVEIDKDKLVQIFRQLVQRHESIRTSFAVINEEPKQKVHKQVDFEIEYYDLDDRQGVIGNREAELIRNFIKPFNLSKVPLFRIGMIKTEKEGYILLVDMHHIISDGTSIDILVNDFMTLYQGGELNELRIQYKDYAEWQASKKEKGALQGQEEYWVKEFEGEIPLLNLPTDYTRPVVQSFEGNRVYFEISDDETRRLKAIALEEGATLYMVLLAAYYVLLSILSGQENIVVGTPVAGRRHADLDQLIGMFVNTLAMKNKPKGEMTFSAFLREVKKKTVNAFENQDFQFEDLVERVLVNRDTSRNPLFDVMFELANIDQRPGEWSQSQVKQQEEKGYPYGYENQPTKFDITLAGTHAGERLFFTFIYNVKLFKVETMERFVEYFKRIIALVQENSEVKLKEINVVDDLFDGKLDMPQVDFGF